MTAMGSDRSGLEMTPEEMRELGHRVVDLIVDRWATLDEAPPWRMEDRRTLEGKLREPAPEEGSDPESVLDRARNDVLEFAARVDHPRFFAFIPGGPTWPSVMADLLSAGFNVFQGTWLGSSGPSQVELVVLDWIKDWMGLGPEWGGLLTSGGSTANLIALVAAREAVGGLDGRVLYVGDQGHSSVIKAAVTVGMSRDAIRTVPSDESFRLDLGALSSMIEADRAAGHAPLAICAAAGATNTGAVDDIEALADLATREATWLHVDGAYGAFAALDRRERERFSGLGRADSLTVDPHKWFYQPFETGGLLLRRPDMLHRAFRISAEYLQDTELGDDQINFGDRGVQLSRRFRALRIWMSVQMLGSRAFREAIGRSLDLAGWGADFIRSQADLEFLAPPSLGILCFRYRPQGTAQDDPHLDRLNARIQERVVESGVAMISSTVLGGKFALRLCILNYRSSVEDVARALQAIVQVAQEEEAR
jgi:glutamate/tyrosine decarboxylase-like PLP-dependent enzyme